MSEHIHIRFSKADNATGSKDRTPLEWFRAPAGRRDGRFAPTESIAAPRRGACGETCGEA